MEPSGTEASVRPERRDVLGLPVLLLNRHFAPVTVATAKRAFCLLYGGAAHAVDHEGDTHDFEYYRDDRSHYFVNGGGGAYLSIGTSLDWPERAALGDYAFYPPTAAVTAKLAAETPFWKWPAWWWVRRYGAWPFSVEALSAVFDFNRAPFFQSFVEVRVERSRNRVVFAVLGVDGPLRWRELAIGGSVMPDRETPDDRAEIVVPLRP